MISNITQSPLRTYSRLPKSWEARPNLINYDQADPAIHWEDGWRDYVQPTFDPNTHRLGELFYDRDQDVVTREVIALTDEELKARKISQAEGEREMKIQETIRKQVETQAQAITEEDEALEKKDIFPLWSSFDDGFEFPIDFKVQDFEGLELKLFRCIQAHAKQSDWNPIAVPALFTKIEKTEAGIEIWSQPTGGDGKYPYLDPATGKPYQVQHNGQTWENTHQGGLNVWEPGVFGWQQL